MGYMQVGLHKWEWIMLMVLMALMVWSGIAPADRAVWVVESVWSVLTVAMAGVWEIVEWLYAAIDGGEVGAAFLGSQGDVWDAQKDILCDTFGAICAAVVYWIVRRRGKADDTDKGNEFYVLDT